MKRFYEILNSIDIYGRKFHFLTNKKLKFKTWIGGLITLFLLLIGIIFIFIFGNDFFFRKNPSFTQSSISERYKKINLSNAQIIIAFRTEDVYGNYLNTSKYIFPKIYYYSAIPNIYGEFRSDYKEEYIPFRLCNKNDFEGNENYLELYGNMYCIEWKNKTFGGFWDHEFLYYFEIRLFYCNNSEIYLNNSSLCPSIEEMNQYFSFNTVYFSIYYSNIELRVNDLKNPFSKKHSNYFTYINHNFRKTDRLFLNEQILNDDQGWIISNNKNISTWGIYNIQSDYIYYNNEMITTEGFSTLFYSLNIYMTSNKIYYTRKYLKIPDVLSMIGGLITFIHVFGKVLCISINLNMQKLKIIEYLFDLENEIESSRNNNSDNNTFLNSKSKLIHYKINKNAFSINNKKLLSFKHSKNHKFQNKQNKNYSSIKDIELKTEKETKIKFKENHGLLFYNKLKIKKESYNLINQLCKEKCDIFNYFKIIKNIELIKEIFFNPNQILAIEYIKKINVNIDQLMINNTDKEKMVIKYFKNKFKTKKNSNIDNSIYNKLNEEIKEKIKQNILC